MRNRIIIVKRLLIGAASLFLGLGATAYIRADIPVPISIRVLFEQNGRPFDEPLQFTIECLGWNHGGNVADLKDRPKEIVQSISAECPGYDCRTRHSLYNNPRTTYIAHCDMKVRLRDNRAFTIEKYARSPVADSHCIQAKGVNREPGLLYECTLQFEVPKEGSYATD